MSRRARSRIRLILVSTLLGATLGLVWIATVDIARDNVIADSGYDGVVHTWWFSWPVLIPFAIFGGVAGLTLSLINARLDRAEQAGDVL